MPEKTGSRTFNVSLGAAFGHFGVRFFELGVGVWYYTAHSEQKLIRSPLCYKIL